MTYTASAQTVHFYTSADDGATWDALGSPLTLDTITVNKNSTSALTVGAGLGGSQFILKGVTHRVVFNNGFGAAPVRLASPNFTTSENAKRTDVQGNVWTVDGGTFETASGLTLATETQGTYVDESVGRRAFTWDAVNDRWQMTYGDTGWRDIDDDLTNGWAAVGAKPKIRRLGQTVYLNVPLRLDGSSATDDEFYILTSGFKPFASNTVGLGWLVSGLVTDSPSPAILYVGTAATGDLSCSSRDIRTTGAVEWVTNDEWPSSLPGTASGTIPSGFVEFVQNRNPTLGTADLVGKRGHGRHRDKAEAEAEAEAKEGFKVSAYPDEIDNLPDLDGHEMAGSYQYHADVHSAEEAAIVAVTS